MSSRELEQQHESQKIANWSLGVDIFMTTVKGAVGWMLNSTAIIADISTDDLFEMFPNGSRRSLALLHGRGSGDTGVREVLSKTAKQEMGVWIRQD